MQRGRAQEKSVVSSQSATTAPVVVIGAGISGLNCASILRKNGIDVVVLEAASYVGGRVKSLKGFVDWKDIDLGAEFIHGEKSALKALVDKNGWPCRLLFTWAQGDGETPDYPVGGGISLYYLGKEKTLLRYDTDDPDINKVNELLWGLWELKPAPGDRRTLEQYLRDNGVTERVLPLADSGYANTLCSALERLSLDGVAALENKWEEYGGGDYRLDNSMGQVTERLATDLDIRTEWVVKSINYSQSNTENAIITSASGKTMEASRVVVTVPLQVLKDEDIEFVPPLPQKKRDAIKTIAIDGAMKIVMKFSKRFWPTEVHGVICSDSFVPELWFEEPARVGVLTPQSRPAPKPVISQTKVENKKGTITTIITTTSINNDTGEVKTTSNVSYQPATTYLVSAFACSKNHERITQLSKQQIIDEMLQQLDEMFSNKKAQSLLPNVTDQPYEEGINWNSPATSSFLDCLVHDWGKQPFVKGGYSYPSPGATKQVREELFRPINDRVYFAGEATNPTSCMTLQGAMETGEMVAKLITRSYDFPESIKQKLAARSRL